MNTPLKHLAVVGAGGMGSGIAAARGAPVVLIDPVDGALDRARASIARQLGVAAGDEAEAMARIRMSPDLEAAADCDLVIEAVPENLELKRGIFAKLDAICAPGAIFATNTSGLSINALASAVTRRERFVGTHFFTPADVIPLVEVVRNDDTSEATVAVVMDALRAVGKRPVLVPRHPRLHRQPHPARWRAKRSRCWKRAWPAPRTSTRWSSGAWASAWRCRVRWNSAI